MHTYIHVITYTRMIVLYGTYLYENSYGMNLGVYIVLDVADEMTKPVQGPAR